MNLYGASTVMTRLGTETIALTQETEYPWSGRVRIYVGRCGAKEFGLKLRVPGWISANNNPATIDSVRINGRSVPVSGKAGSYVELKRAWRPGDSVEFDLPMAVRLIEANPLVEEDLGQVAVQRGPIVYCLESPDLPAGVRLRDVRIPADIELAARYDRRLLGGVTVVEGKALARPQADWNDQLYRQFEPRASKPINLRLIPYSVWQNRGPSEMSVWLPLAAAP